MQEELVSGDDTENIVGALTSALMSRGMAAARGAPSRGRAVGRQPFNAAMLSNQVGGRGGDNALRAQLGMGSFVFTSATGTSHKFVVEPQEAYRVTRIVASVAKSEDVGATLVEFDPLIVGSLPQAPSSEFGIPAEMYAPDATNADIDAQICPAGTKLVLNCNLVGAALAEGDSVVVSVGFNGGWIRG